MTVLSIVMLCLAALFFVLIAAGVQMNQKVINLFILAMIVLLILQNTAWFNKL